MAGWKLRKDKTQAETQAAEPETPAEPSTAEGGAEIYSAPSAGEESPAADWGTQWQTPTEEIPVTPAGTEHAPVSELETGGGLHFEDEDGPLKMMDYSVPFTEDLLPLSSAPIIAAPPPVEMPPVEMPPVEMPPADTHPAETLPADTLPADTLPAEMPTLSTPSFNTSATELGDTPGDFTSTLRMSREELASAFAPPPPVSIPPVAPFVLDTPLVSPATEETPPRLVVRFGRLSAAFDLTKEVTVIGRPDSEIHYYPDVEIDLDDAVSRRHAEIIKREDRYFLSDTGSTNGTLLNGEALPAHEERPLAHGDRIRVGERTEIIFE